jgi:membrane protein DedA with SNARE-associated domain
MIENILGAIGHLTPFWIYVALFAFSYIENIFPPAPGDAVVLVAGSLIASPGINVFFFPSLIITTLGSFLGFMTYYYLGKQLDKKVIRAGKIKFISVEALEKAEAWFNKYGYFVILGNRFLPGTRSVISFFAGISELNIRKTAALAALSALLWNVLILYLGVVFGKNVKVVDFYLGRYSNIVLIITVIAAAVLTIRYFLTKKKEKN